MGIKNIIIVGWRPDPQYGQCMFVLESEHSRFTPGSRFDWGFAGIVAEEGYILVINPMTDGLIIRTGSEFTKANRVGSGISVTTVDTYGDYTSTSRDSTSTSLLNKLDMLWESNG